MRIIRIFPRRTKATPTDPLAYFGPPDLFAEADEVHVNVTFTYDMDRAEQLAEQWRHVAPVKIGGPATGMRGEAFVPGMYLKLGYVITSRGCPNRCWFCSVWNGSKSSGVRSDYATTPLGRMRLFVTSKSSPSCSTMQKPQFHEFTRLYSGLRSHKQPTDQQVSNLFRIDRSVCSLEV